MSQFSRLTYTREQADPRVTIPDGSIASIISVLNGRQPTGNWAIFMGYCAQLDRESVPSDLRQSVARFVRGVCYFASSGGGALGPTVSGKLPYGSPGFFSSSTANSPQDFMDVPFSELPIAGIIELLEKFAGSDKENFVEYGASFLKWLKQSREKAEKNANGNSLVR
jgi:hypothetical protein